MNRADDVRQRVKSGAPIPAENGSREVEYAPPFGSEETGGSDVGVAARTQVRIGNDVSAGILDPARIAAPQTRSDPTADPVHTDSRSTYTWDMLDGASDLRRLLDI